MNWYIFFGYPGSGKSTQAKLVKEKLIYNYICTGDDLRDALPGSFLYNAFREQRVSEGNFAPDKTMFVHVLDRLSKDGIFNGTIFDGFPRNDEQCRMFDGLLKKFNPDNFEIIHFDIPRTVAFERVRKRYTLEHREDDSNPERTNRRFDTYERVTRNVLAYYSNRGGIPIFNLDGTLEPKIVHDQVLDIISGRVM